MSTHAFKKIQEDEVIQKVKKMTNILKKTKSICPTCLIEIGAEVIEKNNKVYMVKKCPKHGEFIALVEKDAEFYKKIMNRSPVKSVKRITNLMITLTHKCNLNCNFCWLPQRNREDFSIDSLKKIISNSDCKYVRLSGGEPTLRNENDLLDIINFIKKSKKKSVLLTNGLKLANLDFVRKLKKAGLYSICFSFNGFRDDIYEKLNGKKLLKTKLKALENIKKVNIPVSISVMIAKGVNDKEIGKILDYCLENNSFIKELRLRSSTPVGRYIQSDQIFMADILNILNGIGIRREWLLRCIDKNSHTACTHLGCNLLFYKEGDHIYPLMATRAPSRFMIWAIALAFELLRKFELGLLFKLILNEIKKRGKVLGLRLGLRSWPNKYNIDLEGMKRCPTFQLSNKGLFPFCYSLILNSENIIEL